MPIDSKDKEIAELKKKNEKLQKIVDKHEEKKEAKKSKPKKAPSPYNIFMSKQIAIIKKENPDIPHPDAFKQAIEAWNDQKK